MTIRAPRTKAAYPVNLPLIYKLAPHCQWDPSDQRLDAPRHIDQKETSRIFTEHFREIGEEKAIRDITGKTLHYSVSHMPLMNLVIYANGYINLDDLKALWKEGIQETEGYKFCLESDEESLMVLAASQARIHQAFVTEEYKNLDKKIELPSDKGKIEAINTLLDSVSLPSLPFIVNKIEGFDDSLDALKNQIKGHKDVEKKLSDDLSRIQEVVADLQANGAGTKRKEVTYDNDGTIPSGKMTMKKASDIFPDMTLPKNLSVEAYEWEGSHPDVPEIDPHYIFRPELLIRLLYSLLTGQNAWIQGHTGSGKTTLVEQVCARLGKPFVRVNLDSEISRFDLVGKDVLKTEYNEETKETMTVSEFLEGILPRALKMPCVLCMDEIDFIRPDVAYVLQSITEGKGMRLNEDGGRWIQPHPEFNICATANTVGQGDEFGMYQGARPQSMAFIDRFPVFIKVPYMKDSDREDLIKRHYPAMPMDTVKRINQYVEEHIYAFEKAEVIQPITPRGMLAIAKAITILSDEKAAVEMTVLDKANQEDHATLEGISARIFA